MPEAAPDLAAWQRELGIELRLAPARDWDQAPLDAGLGLGQARRHWPLLRGLASRLRPAAWLLAAALVLHALLLVVEWTSLENQQRQLRQQMEASFRAAFPDAVAVADPALQMRRKLADARHAAGQGDAGDFLALLGQFGNAARDLPPGSVRTITHEGGRLGIELAGLDDAALRGLAARLAQSGLDVDLPTATAPGAPVTLTLRAP